MDLMADNFLYLADQVMPDETAIVGDASATFLCTRMDEAENYNKGVFSFATAALVFARDQYKPEGISYAELSYILQQIMSEHNHNS